MENNIKTILENPEEKLCFTRLGEVQQELTGKSTILDLEANNAESSEEWAYKMTQVGVNFSDELFSGFETACGLGSGFKDKSLIDANKHYLAVVNNNGKFMSLFASNSDIYFIGQTGIDFVKPEVLERVSYDIVYFEIR